MAGTPTGTLDMLFSAVTDDAFAAAAYDKIRTALLGASNVTLIADRTIGATGTNFSVWCFNATAYRPWDYYVYLGEGHGTVVHPYIANGSTGPTPTGVSDPAVYFAAARGIGGDGNPWLGTTAADGTDTKPAVFWGAPSGGTGVQVLPSSNGVNGDWYADGRIAVARLVYSQYGGTQDNRLSVWVDDDNLFVAADYSANGSYNVGGLWFAYPGEDNLDGSVYLIDGNTGSPTQNSEGNEDFFGLFDPDMSGNRFESLDAGFSIPEGFIQSNQVYNEITAMHDACMHVAYSFEDGYTGLVGELDTENFSTMVVGTTGGEFWNAGFTRVLLGYTSTGNRKWHMPWHGGSAPGTHGTTAGVAL